MRVTLLTCDAVTYPLDVLRRKMQIQGFSEHHPRYGTTLNCIKQVVATEGIPGSVTLCTKSPIPVKAYVFRSLYRGIMANILKVAPSIGVTFVTYEITKAAIA